MRNGNKWLSFDNPESIKEKVQQSIMSIQNVGIPIIKN